MGLFGLRVSAQVTVELELNQEQFLPCESVPVAVKLCLSMLYS